MSSNIRRKLRGGRSKVRNTETVQVCCDGIKKAKVYLKLNPVKATGSASTGILKVKGKLVKM